VWVFRWGARLLALCAAGFFVAFLILEGFGDVRALSDTELGGLGAVLVMLVGTVAAWRWVLSGGLLLLAGYAAFAAAAGGWPPLPFAPFAVAGVVLLLTGILRRFRRRPTTEPAEFAPRPGPGAFESTGGPGTPPASGTPA
jgi:hypothetical protein